MSKDIAPNYIELEGAESINLNREIEWLVDEYLPDTEYTGVLVFPHYGRAAGYALFCMNERHVRPAA